MRKMRTYMSLVVRSSTPQVSKPTVSSGSSKFDGTFYVLQHPKKMAESAIHNSGTITTLNLRVQERQC